VSDHVQTLRKRATLERHFAFLSQLEGTIPVSINHLFLVLDTLPMHKVQAWLAAHPRFVCPFLPVHCSWMSQVEQWFSML